MPRIKKKPLYDPEASMEELLKALVKGYGLQWNWRILELWQPEKSRGRMFW